MSKESKALAAKSWDRAKITDLLLNNALFILMAVAIIYVAIVNENFLKPTSIVNIISQTAIYLPIAMGIGGCIVLTGTDLAAGRIVGLTACISAALLQNDSVDKLANKMFPEMGTLPIWVVIPTVMLIGAVIGAFSGFFVAKFKLHPFIVTLGTQLIVYTMLLKFLNMGTNGGMAISNLDDSYKDFVKGSFLSIGDGVKTNLFNFYAPGTTQPTGTTPIPFYVFYAIFLAIVMWFIWNKTTFGKNMFALGANEEATRVSGVNVFMTTILVFALAGAMYGFTGFIEGARIGSNSANTGFNYELDAIAACVIGGVSFVGGIGKIRGVIIGVLMLRLIFICLTMMSVNPDYIYCIKGAIILFACALDMRKYLVKK